MGPDHGELASAVLLGETPIFHPNTGSPLDVAAGDATTHQLSPAAAAGLEAPRFCQLCGRRMKVQIRPDGWSALCSRHGALDSGWLDDR